LKKQLIGCGYRVSVANQGQEAIDKVLASQDSPKDMIQIVLMDVEMPILNVWNVCYDLTLGTTSDETSSRS